MGLDLSKTTDFARATSGSIAKVASNFLEHPSEWDIQEGSYNSVKFHVFKSKVNWQGELSDIQDHGGRRKTKYSFPYIDGQTTDDLGAKGDVFTLHIMLHGDRYMSGYRKLFTELNKPKPGVLVHPVRGRVKCAMEDYVITHRSEERKAMTILLTMTTHNFSVARLTRFRDDVSVKSALSKAMKAFAMIDATIAKIEGIVIAVSAVKNDLKSAISQFKSNFAELMGKSNKTYNPGSSNDIPGVLPVSEGGNLKTANGTTSGAGNFPIAASPNDPFQSVPIAQVTDETVTALTTIQLEKEVNDRRAEINAIIAKMSATTELALELYQQILDMKIIATLMQDVLETGKASSQTAILTYTTPRLMSIREVAFANAIDINKVFDIEQLNPELVSVNYIEKGTVLTIPVG